MKDQSDNGAISRSVDEWDKLCLLVLGWLILHLGVSVAKWCISIRQGVLWVGGVQGPPAGSSATFIACERSTRSLCAPSPRATPRSEDLVEPTTFERKATLPLVQEQKGARVIKPSTSGEKGDTTSRCSRGQIMAVSGGTIRASPLKLRIGKSSTTRWAMFAISCQVNEYHLGVTACEHMTNRH